MNKLSIVLLKTMSFYLLLGITALLLGFGASFLYHSNHLPTNDCVPATLHRIFPAYTESDLCNLLETDDGGTMATNVLIHWFDLTTNKLILIYACNDNCYDEMQKYKAVIINTNYNIVYGKPYLWFGKIDLKNGEFALHCALVYFTETNMVMSNSQFYQNSTNYYNVTWNVDDFLDNTLMLFSSQDMINNQIRLQ